MDTGFPKKIMLHQRSRARSPALKRFPLPQDDRTCLRLPALLPGGGRLRVDQDESDAAYSAAVVDPGMVRALLDQHIARLQMNLRVVHQHVDFAIEHDGIVDASGAMSVAMAHVALGRRIDAHAKEDLFVVDMRRRSPARCRGKI